MGISDAQKSILVFYYKFINLLLGGGGYWFTKCQKMEIMHYMGIGCGVRFDGGKGLTSGMVQVRVEGEGQE